MFSSQVVGLLKTPQCFLRTRNLESQWKRATWYDWNTRTDVLLLYLHTTYPHNVLSIHLCIRYATVWLKPVRCKKRMREQRHIFSFLLYPYTSYKTLAIYVGKNTFSNVNYRSLEISDTRKKYSRNCNVRTHICTNSKVVLMSFTTFLV